MNWYFVVLQAVAIAGLSAIISVFVSRNTKSLDFAYDYRKYVLEKRKAAYDKLEPFVNGFLTRKQLEAYVNEPQHLQWAKIEHKLEDLASIGLDSVWFTRKITNAIMELSTLVKSFRDHVEHPSDDDTARRSENAFNLVEIEHKLVTRYFQDIMELDNIAKFRASKKAEHVGEGALLNYVMKKS